MRGPRQSLARRAVAFGKRRLGPALAARQPERVDPPLSVWGLSVSSQGKLNLGDVDLEDLAVSRGTPLHLVDLSRLDAMATSALQPFAAGRGADIFYSYKTNPVPGVLRRLHQHGVGAEVISEYELWLALELGLSPSRIVFNGPAKSDAALRLAIQRGVHLINANSLGEVERIARIAAEERTVAKLGIRIAVAGSWGGQFGVDERSPQLADAIRIAQAAPFIALCGVHVHRGGTIRSADEWTGYVSIVLHLCDRIRSLTGWSPSVLDLGGSLACPTVCAVPRRQLRLNRAFGTDLLAPDPDDVVTIAQASELAAAMTGRHFEAAGLSPPVVIQEPGRALTAGAQLLLTSVVDVKRDVTPVHAVLDAGSNLADPLPAEYHQVLSASTPSAPTARTYRLAGPICTPADVLYYGWRLPELEVGDVLAILDTGAYFVPFSNSFSFPQPAILAVEDGTVTELRRRETFEDIVARDGLSAKAAVEQS